MVRAPVQLDKERHGMVLQARADLPVREEKLRLQQMLKESGFPDTAIADHRNIICRLSAQICQGCFPSVLCLSTGQKMLGRNIPLGQQALNNIQLVETASLPPGCEKLCLRCFPELTFHPDCRNRGAKTHIVQVQPVLSPEFWGFLFVLGCIVTAAYHTSGNKTG